MPKNHETEAVQAVEAFAAREGLSAGLDKDTNDAIATCIVQANEDDGTYDPTKPGVEVGMTHGGAIEVANTKDGLAAALEADEAVEAIEARLTDGDDDSDNEYV